MKLYRSMFRVGVSLVTTLAFLVETTGLAYADPPEIQPVPYAPSQPVPLPVAPPSTIPPAPTLLPPPPPANPLAPAPSPGYAPSPAPHGAGDTVYLKDGGLVRGTLLEMLPNDHVTVQLATGQSSVIEWGRIDHIERATLVPAPSAPLVEGRGRPRAPRHRAPGPSATVLVHIDSDEGVVLEALAPGGRGVAVVCKAPCDAQLPIEDEYRLAGPGIRPSRFFHLEAAPGQHVVISVSSASRSGYQAGLALTSVGSAAIAVGLVVLFFGVFSGCEATDMFGNCVQTTSNPGVETAGGVIAGVGAAVLVTGVILWASNRQTTQTQSVVAKLVSPPPGRPDTAWLRVPVWHDSVRESSGLAKPMGFPVFSRAF